jgi:hypothetical protein
VHAHLAKIPKPAVENNPNIPLFVDVTGSLASI